MGLCPNQCTPQQLIANPSQLCATDFRRKTLSRLFMYPCQTDLPNPITPAGMKALFDAGTIVSTVELANIAVEAPATEQLSISDCRPAVDVVNTRTITFEDRTAIKTPVTFSPGISDHFFDYDFWLDKLGNYEQISYMWAYCDGDVLLPTDKLGNQLFATLTGFLDWQKAQAAGGPSTELKKFKITFQGDPFHFNKPIFNWIAAGIHL